MATGANLGETYSISEPRTGSARVSRIVLTGHGAAPSAAAGLRTFSDDGRLWGRYTNSSTLLELFRRPTMLSGDRVAYTSAVVSGGKATLVQDNSSGISGTCDIDNGTPGTNPTADSTFDLIVSYADEQDIFDELDAAESLLVAGKWQGRGTRFEALLDKAKKELDAWIVHTFAPRLKLDDWGRWRLANLVNQRDLARIHALIACHMAVTGRSGFADGALDKAAFYLDLARQSFKTFNPVFDYERDLTPNDRAVPGVITVRRS